MVGTIVFVWPAALRTRRKSVAQAGHGLVEDLPAKLDGW